MDIKEKLRLLRKSSSPVDKPAPVDRDYQAIALALDGELIQDGSMQLVRRRDSSAGSSGLRAMAEWSGDVLRKASRNRVSDRFSATEALFVDTETTGLMGGSGTYVFLLGLAWFEEDNFVIEQLFLPRLMDEPFLLDLMEQRLADRRGLISFNGKSYDIPLLAARCRQNRKASRLDLHQHFDVLHAARRLWRDDFGSCSLQSLETHVLGESRTGDIPGEDIPAEYWRYLKEGEPGALTSVMTHNHRDLVTTAALVHEICSRFEGRSSAREGERVAGVHAAIREYQEAAQRYKILLQDETLNAEQRIACQLRLADALKRSQDYSGAVAAWQKTLENGNFSHSACIELAKYYEHQAKDFESAIQVTRRALDRLEMQHTLQPLKAHEAELAALRKRMLRLQNKHTRHKKSATE